jgi:hypothetical protein
MRYVRSKRNILLHRVVGRRAGLDLKNEVDHQNRDKLDNRRRNLRAATKSQQKGNEAVRKSNKSGFKGVSWAKHAKKWRACIWNHGKRIHIGYFLTKQQAAMAYNTNAEQIFGVFAWLNPL